MARTPKPGVYDHVVGTLKREPVSDMSAHEKIEAIKVTIVDRDGRNMAAQYTAWRVEKARLAKELATINNTLAAYEQLLSESQERQAAGWGDYGMKDNALKLANGVTIRVKDEPYGQVIDKEKFRLWCIENGYERQLQLWPSRMNTLVKERLKVGQPEPDGCTAYVRTKVRIDGLKGLTADDVVDIEDDE